MHLKLDEINATTATTASTFLNLAIAPRVISEPTIDSKGDEALRVIVVLSDDEARQIDGDTALDLMVKIDDDLRAKGEERFPIVEFATEQELAAGDDPDS